MERSLSQRRTSQPSPGGPSTRRSAWALYTLLSVTFINILGFGIVAPLLLFCGVSFHAPMHHPDLGAGRTWASGRRS